MVFMSTPRTAGINLQKKPIYARGPDGQELVDETGNKMRDDETATVIGEFRR